MVASFVMQAAVFGRTFTFPRFPVMFVPSSTGGMTPRGGQDRKAGERQAPDYDKGEKFRPGTGQIKRHSLLLFGFGRQSLGAASTGEKRAEPEPNLKSPFSEHSCPCLAGRVGGLSGHSVRSLNHELRHDQQHLPAGGMRPVRNNRIPRRPPLESILRCPLNP
jgi:hypothetical protein